MSDYSDMDLAEAIRFLKVRGEQLTAARAEARRFETALAFSREEVERLTGSIAFQRAEMDRLHRLANDLSDRRCAAEAEVERLRLHVAALERNEREVHLPAADARDRLGGRVQELEAEVERLKKALRPFSAFDVPRCCGADDADVVYGSNVMGEMTELTVGDFRRARTALARGESTEETR